MSSYLPKTAEIFDVLTKCVLIFLYILTLPLEFCKNQSVRAASHRLRKAADKAQIDRKGIASAVQAMLAQISFSTPIQAYHRNYASLVQREVARQRRGGGIVKSYSLHKTIPHPLTRELPLHKGAVVRTVLGSVPRTTPTAAPKPTVGTDVLDCPSYVRTNIL